MDEFPKMQRLQAVIHGPDLGRGCKVSYLIIGQDLHQIAERYGQDAAATIISTTAAKIVLRQNDVKTAKDFSEMMGERKKKKKDGDGYKKDANGDDLIITGPLYSEMDIRTLDDKKQLVIYQGWARRPIEADKQYWWADDSPLKSRKLPEAPPLPEHLVGHHIRAMGYDERKIEEARKRAKKI
jgi:type IV secretion system protein VirD4